MSLLGSSRRYTPHLILTLVTLTLMVSGVRAEGPDPAALQQPLATSGSGSVKLTSTVVKIGPAQPPVDTGPSPTNPSQESVPAKPAEQSSPSSAKTLPNPSPGSFQAAGLPKKLSAAERAAMRNFERAKMSFNGFCKDWEHKLSDREHDNIEAIKWKLENGSAFGRYLGYSKINTCTCKQSTHGQLIGELTYGETNNDLSGKTVDEAKHAKPKSTLTTETTEIFGWSKKGWEY